MCLRERKGPGLCTLDNGSELTAVQDCETNTWLSNICIPPVLYPVLELAARPNVEQNS